MQGDFSELQRGPIEHAGAFSSVAIPASTLAQRVCAFSAAYWGVLVFAS